MPISYNEMMTVHCKERTVLYVNDEGEVASVRVVSAPLRAANDAQDTVFVLNRLDVEEPRILHKPLREICRTREEVIRLQASHNAALNEQLHWLKVEERKAFVRLLAYHVRQLCNIAFVVFVILKLTGNVDWSWWLVTAPIWGGFLVNVIIAIVVRIAYRFKK